MRIREVKAIPIQVTEALPHTTHTITVGDDVIGRIDVINGDLMFVALNELFRHIENLRVKYTVNTPEHVVSHVVNTISKMAKFFEPSPEERERGPYTSLVRHDMVYEMTKSKKGDEVIPTMPTIPSPTWSQPDRQHIRISDNYAFMPTFLIGQLAKYNGSSPSSRIPGMMWHSVTYMNGDKVYRLHWYEAEPDGGEVVIRTRILSHHEMG